MKYPVVFTDLDGTLLDHATYSHEPALPALRLLREKQVPLVLCSSKTRTEIEHYRRLLDNHDPFVSENGGGIFIPDGYFNLSTFSLDLATSIDAGGTIIISLGTPYPLLRQTLQELRQEGFALTGFGDMTVAEVAELTGLPLAQAAMAKARDFDEPFVFNGSTVEADELSKRILDKGFHSTRGEFFHLLGNSDKGIAVEILAALYRQKLGELVVIALGDSLNDLPMLQRADFPVVIKKPTGSHNQNLAMPRAILTQEVGPAGWNEAVLQLLGHFASGG